ncbi:MAG: hypothetical protein ACI8S6_003833 [Myxococcota bacterium]|jgi:hypothetical protein
MPRQAYPPRSTPAAFDAARTAGGWHILGVVGSSGGMPHPPPEAEAALSALLREASEAHGERLWVVSGATDVGVPGLTHRLCRAAGIQTAGLTAAQGLEYSLAPLDMLIVVGERFGDESDDLLALCDALIILGGGPQAEREARGALEVGIPVTAVTGFGGAADAIASIATRRW